MKPRLVYADKDNNLFDHPDMLMLVDDGRSIREPHPSELIDVPEGSDLFVLPGRSPMGKDPATGKITTLQGLTATSTFVSPAYLRLTLPAAHKNTDAPDLPLFAYAPLGFVQDRFVTTALRVDPSPRQDPIRFDRAAIKKEANRLVRTYPNNRLIRHLKHCALVYGCRAAQNLMLCREEAPLPASTACNAACLGCISASPAGDVCASHDRISFVPTPEELAEVALLHIGRAKDPVVSFGQGCEGEPLLVADTLTAAIGLIRSQTTKGTIHCNTNGSLPDAVSKMLDAGLNSIRLSLNSFRTASHNAYFRPRNFALDHVLESGNRVHQAGGFVSVNLLVFPGFSDTPQEVEATIEGLAQCKANFVQMRNLNIDPDIYRNAMKSQGKPIGLKQLMDRIKENHPHIEFGYFNPPLGRLG